MSDENDGSDYTGIDEKNKKEDQNKSMRELSENPLNIIKFYAGIPKNYSVYDCKKLIDVTNIRCDIITTILHLQLLLEKLDKRLQDRG